MTERRVLRFVSQNPVHPWWKIGEFVGEALVGFTSPGGHATRFNDRLLSGVGFGLYTPRDLAGSLYNPLEVAAGRFDVGITTPSATAAMAMAGVGPYKEQKPSDGLRAIAAYPHDDFLIFQIDRSLGITNLDELRETRPPLRLVTGRLGADGSEDILTFVVHEILRQYGVTFRDIESWGGEVIFGGPTHVGGHLMLSGEADTFFNEAQGAPIWRQVARERDVSVLGIRDDVRQHMAGSFGLRQRTIPVGHGAGNTAPVETVDFSGWLVFVREDFPADWAHALARACDETRPQVDRFGENASLVLPVDPQGLFRDTVIPLHAGAEAYAQECGYLA